VGLEELVASAGLEELEASVGLEELVASAGLEELVASAGLEEPVGLVESAAETVHRLCRPAAATGSTTPNIAAAPLIGIGRPRTGLVARRAVIRWPTVRLAPGARFNGRGVMSAATALEAGAAIGPAEAAWVIEREEVATGLAEAESATEREAAEAIASETGISPGAVAGTGTPSEAGTGGIADRVLALAVTAARRAWVGAEAEADVAAAVVVGGDDNWLSW